MKTKLLITCILLTQIVSAQWQRINNSPAQATYIYFYNSSLGYTLKGNEIHKTTNGGTTWNQTPTSFGSYDQITTIYFASPDTGFIHVTNSMTFSYPVTIYFTINGGATWNPLLGPFNNCYLDLHISTKNDWHFYLNTNGLNIDTIYHTTNGGTTWTKTANASVVQYNQAINNLTVYKDSVNSTNANLFCKSSNGGATWNALFTDNTPLSSFMDHQFLPNNYGYVLLYQYNDNDNIPSKIYRTADGGQTWVNYNLPLTCKAPQSLHFIDANTGYIISHNTNQSVLYKTTDGGQTWNQDLSALANEYFLGTGISEYFGTLYLLGNAIISNKLVTTSVHELEKDKTGFHVFPNPSSGRLIITDPSSGKDKKFAILDLTGKELHSFVMEQDLPMTIDISFLDKGVYLMKNKGNSETILFIKE